MHGITAKSIALASSLMVVVGITTSNQLANGDMSIFAIENNLMELSSAICFDNQAKTEEEKILALFRQAEAYQTKGMSEKALNSYKKVIEENYSQDYTWQAHQLRASLLERKDNFNAAISEYSEFIDAARPGILKNLAISYRAELFEKLGNQDQAQMDREMLAQMR